MFMHTADNRAGVSFIAPNTGESRARLYVKTRVRQFWCAITDVTEGISNCPCNGEEKHGNIKNISTSCIQIPAGQREHVVFLFRCLG